MNVLFQNIRVINPEQQLDEKVNLHIINDTIASCNSSTNSSKSTNNSKLNTSNLQVNGTISSCDSSTNNSKSTNNNKLNTSNLQVIDAKELVAVPGFIDMHVHLREPGFTDKESIATGSAAAANGGFTEIVCMPNTMPAIDNIIVAEYIKSKSLQLPVNIRVAAAITKNREGNHLAPMLELNEAGVIYFTDDGNCVSSAAVMKRAFDFAATRDLLIAQHCEEHSLTTDFSVNESELSFQLGLIGYPSVAEEIIIERDVRLAEYSGNRRYHIQHISTSGSVEIIRSSKSKGLRVSCEVTPHHFYFTDDAIKNYNNNFKMNPPLRKQYDINAIISALRDGTIDCVASDHAPHSLYDCDVEFEKAPNGVIGLETLLGAVLTKLYHQENFSLNKIVELLAINPRKIMQLPQVKIAAGEIANLTIFAPEEVWQVDTNKFLSKATNTPFAGMQFKGKPKYIINKKQLFASVL